MSTRDQILKTTRDILSSEGLGAVSFDAIANRLGLSKQAVIYWFPTKRDLLAAMFLPWLEAETETAIAALANAKDQPDAISVFVRSVATFHFDDLDRFRMMYLVPQTTPRNPKDRTDDTFIKQVHPITGRLYGALADHLTVAPDRARQQAVAIHAAILGMVLMFGLADSLQDPLKHTKDEMIAALIARLTNSSTTAITSNPQL